MFTLITVLFFLFERSTVFAAYPPMNGECENNFIDVNPLTIMGQWTVMIHTDNLHPPVGDSCLCMQFGRTVTWGSNFRMDTVTQVKDNDGLMVEHHTMRVDVASSKEKGPFLVSKAKVPKVFPPTIMITKMAGDEENQCLAAWTCDKLEDNKHVQKGAWIACKSPSEVDEDTLNALVQNIIEQSGIEESYFITTNHEECTF